MLLVTDVTQTQRYAALGYVPKHPYAPRQASSTNTRSYGSIRIQLRGCSLPRAFEKK
jgi:hypothetical protein